MRLPLSLLVLLAATASAQPATVYTDRAAFDADAPGLPVETFDEATTPDDTVENIPAPLDNTTDNAVFASGSILPGLTLTTQFSSICSEVAVAGSGIGGATSPRVGNDQLCDLFLGFAPGVTAVGFDAQALNGFDVNVSARDADGNTLGFYLIEDDEINFIGFISDTPIARIVIDSGVSFDEVFVDNVAFGDASTPTSDVSVAINTFTNDIERGESVFFRGPIANTGDASQDVYLYFTVERPDGSSYRKNLGGFTLDPGDATNIRRFRKNFVPLPEDAQVGTWTVTVFVAQGGRFGPVLDSDSFQFTLPPAPGLTASYSPTGAASLESVEPVAAPNPFRDATEITYVLADAADVDLRVYDVTGREVAALVSGTQSAGTHAATLRADGLPSGTYIWRLTVGGEVTTGRVTLTR